MSSKLVFIFMTPPLFYPNFGVFPLDQIADVGVNPIRYLRQWSYFRSIFEVFQPIWSLYLNVTVRHTDGHTDGRTDNILWQNRAHFVTYNL